MNTEDLAVNSERSVCDVPTDTAVKIEIVSCLISEAHNLEGFTLAAAIVSALAALGTLGVAIWAGKIALGQLDQMKRDSHSQSRPYVFVQVVPGLGGVGSYDLVIENAGQSRAHDLHLSTTPAPADDDDFTKGIAKLFAMKHSLPPGVRLRNFWRVELPKGHTSTEGAGPWGMPESATITVTYTDEDDYTYEDAFDVTTEIYHMAPMPTEGPNPQTGLSDDQIDTHKMPATIASAIGELRR